MLWPAEPCYETGKEDLFFLFLGEGGFGDFYICFQIPYFHLAANRPFSTLRFSRYWSYFIC